jgi:hypothetical protein
MYTVRIAPDQTSDMTKAMASSSGSANALPLFTYTVESNRDNNSYSGVIVGRDPFANGGHGQASVDTPVIPLVIITYTVGTAVDSKGIITTKAGKTVFDPSVENKTCLSAPNDVPLKLVAQSPIFQSAHFNFGGTEVGYTQYIDAIQRSSFWNVIDKSSYHIRLVPRLLGPVVIFIPSNKGLALATTALGPHPFCAPLGIINLDTLDSIITKQVLPALSVQGVNPSTFPIFLLANVVTSSGAPTDFSGCCFLGYHGTYGFPIQTYTASDFDSTGLFPRIRDTAILSLEVGEWANDPFGTNPTPPWRHTGKVRTCQSNLEVGDPFSGNNAPPIFMPNGFTYHLQELAFFSWFFQTPSIGIHGWFSNNDTFVNDAGPPCQ